MDRPIRTDIFTEDSEYQVFLDVLDGLVEGRLSYRDGAKWLEQETGKSISHMGLRNKITPYKNYKDSLLSEGEGKQPPRWETNPEEFEQDEDGNFLLKVNGEPRKKKGKKQGSSHNHHSATKKKQRDRQRLRASEKKVQSLEKRYYTAKDRVNKKKEAFQKYDTATTGEGKSAVMQEEELEYLPEHIQEEVEEDDGVSFRANPGPQTDFLAAPEKDVLYGGAAGGGKSYAMLVDPLRYAHNRNHRFLILRKSLNELGELIDKSKEIYPIAFPGAKFREQKRMWDFPSGAKGFFGYLEKDSDVLQYQGRSFTWIGFDEITHLPTEYAWNYLGSRLRTTDKEIQTYLRCTANPGGPGHHWVKKRYVDPAPNGNEAFEAMGITRKFIPAKLQDNPHLYNDGNYETMLKTMTEIERRRLLEGDWEVAEGAAFPEFDRDVHVITPMEIPPHWERVKAIDYGYAAPSAVVWGAVDPEDGTVIIYRELYQKGLEPTQLARAMTEMESTEFRTIPGVIDGQCFARTGHTGPTQAESIIKAGHKVRRADKNRTGGKVQLHEYLRKGESGKPSLMITSNCVETIREIIGIPLDDKNPEDVDTHADDHAYDALRYLIMSRPRREGLYNRMARHKSAIYMPADSVVGY